MSDIISQIKDIAEDILPMCTAKIRKSFKDLFIETLILFVVMDKVNFTQLSRYGSRNEKTYRHHFEKPDVDTVLFNLELAKRYFGDSIGLKAIAFDPCHISKSGRKTMGVDYFWSGCANSTIWGLEIAGIGLLDTSAHDCIMLGAVQTPPSSAINSNALIQSEEEEKYLVGRESISDYEDIKDQVNIQMPRPYHKRKNAVNTKDAGGGKKEKTDMRFTLVDWYLNILTSLPECIHDYTSLVVADAFFSKKKFIQGLADKEYELVSRLRDDAALWYLHRGMPTGKRGRPKMFDGKVDYDNLDKNVFCKVDLNADSGECFTGKVYSKSLGMEIKVVIWFSDDYNRHKIYFSNRLSLTAIEILEVYKSRFQIEFNFRSGKGYASLNKCQARSMNKLRTHFNMSFTSINCLKLVAKENGIPFSISSLKTMVHAHYLMNRFISVSGISPNNDLIDKLNKEVITLTRLDKKSVA